MVSSPTRHEWEHERERWAGFYAERLALQLRQVTAFAAVRRDKPDTLRPHFESCLTLLEATANRHDLSALWLDLADTLHPWPLRWGVLVTLAGRVAAGSG